MNSATTAEAAADCYSSEGEIQAEEYEYDRYSGETIQDDAYDAEIEFDKIKIEKDAEVKVDKIKIDKEGLIKGRFNALLRKLRSTHRSIRACVFVCAYPNVM